MKFLIKLRELMPRFSFNASTLAVPVKKPLYLRLHRVIGRFLLQPSSLNFAWRPIKFFVVTSIISMTAALANNQPIVSHNWYDDLIFKNEAFTFEFIRTLGYAYSGGADLGESVATARKIRDDDIDSWYQQWLLTANRIYQDAVQMQSADHVVSAREGYLRASNYFRTAAFFMNAASDRSKYRDACAKGKLSFVKAIASLPYVQQIRIPYENTTLPGYFIRSYHNNAPLLVVQSGFDGTAEELYFAVGIAARERGYNVLLFEGPGQGEVLRQQNLPFRYDWEKVVTPVINYAMTVPNINKNKIALMGISMGSYFAARAAAFEPRIKACIVNGALFDIYQSVSKGLPISLIDLLNTDPTEFNKIISNEMQSRNTNVWFFNHALWAFHAESPSDLMQKFKQYNLASSITKIRCPVLVVNSEADIFDPNQEQAMLVYHSLIAPRTLLIFTRAESAQAHCQAGAIAISNARIFNWLDKKFQYAAAKENYSHRTHKSS